MAVLKDADEQDVLLGINPDSALLNRLAGTDVLITLPRPKPILQHLAPEVLAKLCLQNGANNLAMHVSNIDPASQQ